MARGRQPSPEQLVQEAHMEAMAVLYEAVDRDRVEWSQLRELLETLHTGLALAGPAGKGREHFEHAAVLATELLREDRVENVRHRTAIRSLQAVSA